eukprot:8918098-Pyramimonas_sp.AAC.1
MPGVRLVRKQAQARMKSLRARLPRLSHAATRSGCTGRRSLAHWTAPSCWPRRCSFRGDPFGVGQLT